VILADPTARIAASKAHRFIDAERHLCAVRIGGWSPTELLEHEEEEVARDIAEGVRVAYVAATRARDLLVVPALGDGPWGDGEPDKLNASSGWVSPLNQALYPAKVGWAKSTDATGCPRFGRDSVVDRPRDLALGANTMRPGAHAIADSHEVVWWDPHALKLGVPPLFGVRQEELMSKDTEEAIVIADAHEFQNWEAEREMTIHRARTPALSVVTATARAVDTATSDSPPVERVDLPRDRNRPSGARFGALVHAVLGSLPIDADASEIRRFVELEARILGATEPEREAAHTAVEAVWHHPVLERARAADARGECRRETPITLREDDGTLVDGVVDLAFREDARWTVVDYKTDREITDAFEAYERQVALYARAIAVAMGEPASAVLMRV
jgi:ATP-dependent exoDNAse (exonuclease V) beta subunit